MNIITTEQKIIMAANKLFIRKGYTATGTRDIADEANINLALINYYFDSKENLFKEVVQKELKTLLNTVKSILSNENMTSEDKIISITENYTNLLLEKEHLLIVILNELSVNKKLFANITQSTYRIRKPMIKKQFEDNNSGISDTDLVINMMSLIVFPFIAKSLIISSGLINENEFEEYVIRRKEKILKWIISITK